MPNCLKYQVCNRFLLTLLGIHLALFLTVIVKVSIFTQLIFSTWEKKSEPLYLHLIAQCWSKNASLPKTTVFFLALSLCAIIKCHLPTNNSKTGISLTASLINRLDSLLLPSLRLIIRDLVLRLQLLKLSITQEKTGTIQTISPARETLV